MLTGSVPLEAIKMATINMEYAMAAETFEVDMIFVWTIIQMNKCGGTVFAKRFAE